jgi:serine/threonine protein kinase
MGFGCCAYLGAEVVAQLRRLRLWPRTSDQRQEEQHLVSDNEIEVHYTLLTCLLYKPIPDTDVPPKNSHSTLEDVRGGPTTTTGLDPNPSTSGSGQEGRELDTHLTTAAEHLEVPPDRSPSRPSISETSTLNRTASEAGRSDDPELSINRNRDSSDNLSDESLPSESTLRDKLCNARHEWPEGSFRYFIAVDDFNQIVTREAISLEMERCRMIFLNDEAREHTLEEIWKSAPKLFAILVCLKKGKLIADFLDEAVDDTDLPFVRLDNTAKSGHFKLCSRKTPDQPVKCMMMWDQARVNDFGRDQWCFLAPIFEYHDDINHYELNDNCVLPWVEDEERSDRAIEGGFGSVWKIAIHPAHQQIHSTVGPKVQLPNPKGGLGCTNGPQRLYRFVALKRLHLKDKQSFKSEVEMLKLLGRREHTHLVSLLATFRLKGRYYLLFPYANCNLREYWKRTPLPDFSEATVSWTLSQCKAMASALHNVHEYKPTHTSFHGLPPSDSSSSEAYASSCEDEERRYGRHGDIKAENILWFLEDAMDERGHLVIADFGLTAFHKKATRSEVNAGHITGTPSYEAPELPLHSKISRAFDIWSLGCLYLEFVTWLVGGWEHLKRFPDAREKHCEPEMTDDTFFTIIGGEHRAEVRQSVKDWINDLHEMPRCSAFVHDLLNLISESLLVVDPQARIRTAHLNAELNRMIQKREKCAYYLTAPRPTPPRLQGEAHPLSLAAVVRNGPAHAPKPSEGEPLPKRSSTAFSTEASYPLSQTSIGISAPSSSRPEN